MSEDVVEEEEMNEEDVVEEEEMNEEDVVEEEEMNEEQDEEGDKQEDVGAALGISVGWMERSSWHSAGGRDVDGGESLGPAREEEQVSGGLSEAGRMVPHLLEVIQAQCPSIWGSQGEGGSVSAASQGASTQILSVDDTVMEVAGKGSKKAGIGPKLASATEETLQKLEQLHPAGTGSRQDVAGDGRRELQERALELDEMVAH
ncbi:hypothetical protein CYMTET_30311 [Cymbomonas tetramitiformis]|uniref:Uncharacterized protein n=1 Tax=Cymbomonas tetramitiformis TaxID=36881 RepID=A0AAE0FKN9_9CHLO|nr:hypothetical protein CYMTET_30311 [Cymbomonas tetramitiformis]